MNNPLYSIKNTIHLSTFKKIDIEEIFNSVKKDGIKIVTKYNKPICVMIPYEKYNNMIDEIEDARLLQLAMEREKLHANIPFISLEELLKQENIEIDSYDDVEIE